MVTICKFISQFDQPNWRPHHVASNLSMLLSTSQRPLNAEHSPDPSAGGGGPQQTRGRAIDNDRNQSTIKRFAVNCIKRNLWNLLCDLFSLICFCETNTLDFSALFELKNPLNVLVLGPHDSGKTTVINSLLMAVRKQWCDRARYGHGGKHQFAPVTLYENPTHHKRTSGQAHHHHE